MKLKTNRDEILVPLQTVHSVVERRQSLPILGNVLLSAEAGTLTLTATDMEVETVVAIPIEGDESGQMTLPARKFVDIVRALPAGSVIQIESKEKQATLRSGRSRFSLATMPAVEFPSVGEFEASLKIKAEGRAILAMIQQTQFAMAHNDVRYYLNGLLLEFSPNRIRSVATDGHRLALAELEVAIETTGTRQIIVPRKGVLELLRILETADGEAEINVSDNHVQALVGGNRVTSKLIDGKYPDYERVIPRNADKLVIADREALRQGLARTAILSNEKFRGVRFLLSAGSLTAQAHNPDQEEAEEVIEVTYDGGELEIGFNANYVLDVLNTLRTEQVRLEFSDSNSSCLITPADGGHCRYVVMPMRL
ncbi:MAG: DNA polymerase III subunit beta [Gammaproteobacteria bacterium]